MGFFGLDISQRRIVVSSLAETRVLPSGENATLFTKLVCPVILALISGLPRLERSQMMIVVSLLPEASRLPSGLNAIVFTNPECILPFGLSRVLKIFLG